MTAPLEVDVFWSFRSPWSYLATPRLRKWQESWELRINFRPVYPIAIRTPEFFHRVDPLWPHYFQLDLRRCSEYLGIPLTWPKPDPVVQYLGDDGRSYTSEDQPYIHRLTRLGIVAAEQGRGIEFADEMSSLIWTGTEDWHLGDHMAEATDRAGLDLEEMDRIVETERDRLEAEIHNNEKAHREAGHWGVPTCAFKGEPFFGQDRLDVLMWRLKQHGLEERATDY